MLLLSFEVHLFKYKENVKNSLNSIKELEKINTEQLLACI